jgi:zinc/manganese transport system substrate-binding protein
MNSRRDLLAGSAALSATLAFSSGARSQASSPPLPVVATFAILADFVARVGADRVVLTSLVALGGDAHVYSPTPADSRALAAARLVFVNGLGFEGWVNRLITSSGTKATIVTATAGVRPLKAEEGGQGHSHGSGSGSGSHGEVDPHAWQSVANAKIYVANIAAALISADPAGKDGFEARAKAYGTDLDALDAEIRAGIARIPAARRRIITSHDAFQYFEKAYGIDFASPRGLSTSAEPSPQAVGRIIRQIKAEKIPAVFIENLSDERLMKRIADETGARIGGTLYADTLTPAGGPASTYIEMIRHNLRQLTAALA